MPFELNPDYEPRADQPRAIEGLVEGLEASEKRLTLLGATGTGKTFSMASVINRLERPALVIAHNKTLAAQLVNEFREFFPSTAVEYFVSYYDHYQPEAYVPQQDLYIEKDASVNSEIDRLRHSATAALLERPDTIIVSSVSCIYGIGSPESYRGQTQTFRLGAEYDRSELTAQLARMHYERGEALERGKLRFKGEALEIQPAGLKSAYRIRFFGDEVEEIVHFDPLTGSQISSLEQVSIWPASHYATDEATLEASCKKIEAELEERLSELRAAGKNTEAERLERRTRYDVEMLRETGFCSGVENYSRIFDGREAGEPAYSLLDYFPDDFLCFVDESHQTIPQIGGMYEGDRARKQTLIDYGFRLPSALDNRPLKFNEFLSRVPQMVMVSATPGDWEKKRSARIVEQIVRPTHIVDPVVEVRPSEGQIDDLMEEVRLRAGRGERTLVTTLTKKMAEDLTNYLTENGFKVRYLHSDVETLERIETIRDLRLGAYDVLVGVNLLREGLDLPEVSLVAIIDADKEGFLRGEVALIQTIGRAARHVDGRVLMYADRHSTAMKQAIRETDRRREIQLAYNREHDIAPEAITKGVSDVSEFLSLSKSPSRDISSSEELEAEIARLEEQMVAAAEELRFEEAARLRDELKELSADHAALTT